MIEQQVTASSYQLDKPLVIGEFASVCGGGEDVPTLFQYSYDNGYQVGMIIARIRIANYIKL